MISNNTNNTIIAKNTMLLYIRMLLIMVVSLYMSRVLLDILGVNDFGIYNVVGGVVTIFAFLNSALGSSTQRYLTYSLGRGELHLKTVFTSSVLIHLMISALILILAETVGLWIFYNKLVIPPDRINAAFWVFQASVGACIVNVLSVPYNSLIIAHERMGAFAYISIIEVLLKLLLVFAITVIQYDKLVLYSLLIFSTGIIVRLIYQIYCKIMFPEASLIIINNWHDFKGMLTFSGWTLIGMLAWTCQTQGLNILLNMFLGPVVNAARSVAEQVNAAIMQIVNNFQLAAKPQIIRLYANHEIEKMNSLVNNVCTFSSFLLLLCIMPIFINVEYVLNIWLVKYPRYAPEFVQIVLLQSLTQAVASPVIMISHATGDMKMPNITGGISCLLTLPICYVLLTLNFCPEIVVLSSTIPLVIKTFWDVYYAHKFAGFSMWYFYSHIYIRIISIFMLTYSLLVIVRDNLWLSGFIQFVVLTILGIIISGTIMYYIGLSSNQRTLILNIVNNKILNKLCRK